MAPVVLWIDEIEKAFASAGTESADGGLSQRMFGTLLSWMQDHRAPIFLIATANNIEQLPPELVRKGRFDEIFFIDLPGQEEREAIFAIHLRKRHRDKANFDIARLVAASEGYSGAEIEQAVVSGLYAAFNDHAECTTEHIVAAINSTRPLSVVMAERSDRPARLGRASLRPGRIKPSRGLVLRHPQNVGWHAHASVGMAPKRPPTAAIHKFASTNDQLTSFQ